MTAEIQNSMLDVDIPLRVRERLAQRKRYTDLFHNFEHGTLAVTRSRTGQQRANSVNGLAGPTNHTANISASKLQFKGDHSAAGNFREHHVIRKFDELANDELEKFSHWSRDYPRIRPRTIATADRWTRINTNCSDVRVRRHAGL